MCAPFIKERTFFILYTVSLYRFTRKRTTRGASSISNIPTIEAKAICSVVATDAGSKRNTTSWLPAGILSARNT